MSGETIIPIIVDAETLARAAAEVMRREGEAYAALHGTPESSLDDSQRALCRRVEARQRALREIELAMRDRLTGRLKAIGNRFALARDSALRLAREYPGFRGLRLPRFPEADEYISADVATLEAMADQLEENLTAYESAFAAAWRTHCAAESASGRMFGERDSIPGSLCYAAAVVPEVERREAGYSAMVRSLHQAERREADAMLQRAEANPTFRPSAETIEEYRLLMASEDLGRKRWHRQRLQQSIRGDLMQDEAAQAEAQAQSSARSTVHQKAFIADLCRQMNWQVVIDPGDSDDPIYVAEEGFSNHLRKLQLSGDGRTVTTTPVQIQWDDPVTTGAELDDELRRLDRAFCGQGGSVLELKQRSEASAVRMGTMRRTGVEFERIEERELPPGLRAKHRAEVSARRGLRERPLPGSRR